MPFSVVIRSSRRWFTWWMMNRSNSVIVSPVAARSEEHTSELQSRLQLVCRLFFYGYGDPRDLPSFSTRRSSDLGDTLEQAVVHLVDDEPVELGHRQPGRG